MDFVKKHYEKILLGAVLLGLLGALVFMPFLITSDQIKWERVMEFVVHPPVKPLPPLDLTRQTDVVKRLQLPCNLDFSTTNRLFNPVEWQRTVDGRIIKATTGVGPQVAVVTKITPLCLILTLDSVVTNELGVRYVLGFERQAATSLAQRRGQRFVSTDDRKKDLFTLVEVQGAPENPDQLVLKLADTGETAGVSRDKPFRRVDGYTADLKYDPEGKKWTGQRVGAVLRFANDDYIIVAINRDSVILSAKSNQKKTTLTYSP
jgi:hypothetical protein